MPAINNTLDLAAANQMTQNTMIAHLGIEFTAIGPDFLSARMPVDQRTLQPFGLLHGGASVALAETLGSMASAACVDLSQQQPVGIEINANHVRSATSGYVFGTARPVHLGGRTHIWEIRIEDDQQRLVCVSRLTIMLVDVNQARASAGRNQSSAGA